MNFSYEQQVTIARLDGDIDLANADAIRSAIGNAVDNDGFGLVIDLSAVRFIDSSGIQVLFDLVRDLATRRQTVCLVVPEGASIARVLKLSRLDEVTSLCETEDEAIAYVRRGDPRLT